MSNNRCRNMFLVLYVLITSAWTVVLPTFEAPDEPEHVGYIEFIVRHHHLPVMMRSLSDEPFEGFQPPLYHAIMAVPYKPTFPA